MYLKTPTPEEEIGSAGKNHVFFMKRHGGTTNV